jgi:hypothetical protein
MTNRASSDDPHLPASEAGSGIIPEDGEGGGPDTHLPASEADTAPLQHESGGEPQSWPGKSFGTILPPG